MDDGAIPSVTSNNLQVNSPAVSLDGEALRLIRRMFGQRKRKILPEFNLSGSDITLRLCGTL